MFPFKASFFSNKIKSYLSRILLTIFPAALLTCLFFSFSAAPALAAKRRGPVYAAFIVDDYTGKVLHKTNADTKTHPASLTKIMTLYMLFEALKTKKITLNTKMKVSRYASRQQPCKLWLKPGSTITVKEAVMALTVKSANDVSVIVAEHFAGSEKKFAAMITKKARALGAKNTTFRTASGLPNRREITTARDMATTFRALYRHFPDYWRYFKHKHFVFRGKKHPTHTRLMHMCKGVDGVKTGFINASGFNLAASAKRGNTRLFAVVLGGHTSKWRDKRITNLINRYFPKAIALNKGRKANGRDRLQDVLWAKNVHIPTKPWRALPQEEILVAQNNIPAVTKALKADTDFQALLIKKPSSILEPDILVAGANLFDDVPLSPKNASESFSKPNTLDDLDTASKNQFEDVDLSTDDNDAETTFVDGLPSKFDSEVLNNIIENESYDDLENIKRPDRTWAAQFGAFKEETDAQDKANLLVTLIPNLPGDVDISPAQNRRTPLYRARLIRITKTQAEKICQKMRFHDIPCLPLKN